jgi:hypothetical protein
MKENRRFGLFGPIGLGLCIVAGIVLTMYFHKSKNASEPVLTLDFRYSRSASQIILPRGAIWQDDSVSLKDQHIEIRFSGERAYHCDVMSIGFERDRMQQIRLVAMVFAEGTIDEDYALAKRFAVDWGLSTKDLDAWRDDAKAGKWDGSHVEIIHNGDDVKLELGIWDSYSNSDAKPARVSFTVSW